VKKEILKISQSSIAQALAADYFCIYFVNVENDKFIEYSASPEYREFGFPSMGDDFISFSRKNFELRIHPDDREDFLQRFTKENIIRSLNRKKTFTMTFRMLFAEGPVYVHLKVTRMIEKEGHHAVIGISSVDDQMKSREAAKRAHSESITYARVAQALSGDYFSIYVVDPDTERFMEYSAAREYEQLGIEKEGEDFFNLSRRNMERVIYPEDKERFLGTFTKENILSTLERGGSFTMKYRLMLNDEPVYVSMKATLVEDEKGRYLIVGTNNIDAQMKLEQEYQARVENAKNRAKNDFLANMSHDIRTPMNAIVGYTNIAKTHLHDIDIVKDSLDKIGSSSHFLLSLINDVLDMSKIESGKMQLSVGKCDLEALLCRIEDITSMQAQSKELKITYDQSGVKHFRVRGDELRIEQVLINIISNAIKYTPRGKSVDLIAEELSTQKNDEGKLFSRYRFVVKDTGVGISEDYLPHLFESFTREENTLVNRVQGTGLGLAITARVVELMGGIISVKSKQGEGSEFTVELDLELDPEKCAEDEGNDLAEGAASAPDEGGQAAGNEENAADLTGRRILIVEDNAVNAEIAKMILSQYGMETDHAENGQIGVEKMKEAASAADGESGESSGEAAKAYDAVLMDIQMPVMNGYEATQAIRAIDSEYCREVPIIAMSANAYDDDVRACLAVGMNTHIAKPFNPEDLIGALKKYLR